MSNTVLIMSDEHNPLVASPYGHPMVQTPHMERLAREGTLFENAYCPSPLCLPSRAAFMAGKRVHQIQTYNNSNACLCPDHPSFGRVLGDGGVHTAYIGKVDVYDVGANLGFSEMLLEQDRGFPGDTNVCRSPLQIREGARKRAAGYGPKPNAGGGDERVVERAVQWLNTTAQELDQPWLLCIMIVNPHFPHYVTQDLWDMYPDGGDLPACGPEHPLAEHPFARDLRDHFETDHFSEKDRRGLRRGYLGCVTHVDRQIGRVVDALQRTGLRDATNVVYTSDHGDMLGKFGMWWKCSLYEDSVRVPLLASGPDFDRDKRVRTSVDLLDVQATLFDTFGVDRPEDWSGTSLRSIAPNDPEHVTFAEYHGHGTRASAYMVRKGAWKLIYCVDAPNLLFDLDSDPGETSDAIAVFPGKAAELEGELRQICDPESESARADGFISEQLAEMARRSKEK
ncbi:MAG: sulfatase-like hydrolase/transferase [Lentisphaerae bacterium]|jgi:choline-sulfatase|nr:sulfatase-like hydrolase/transferase [Lentisphaerota bacterium]MBT4822960.1 sulfatase-like hydrolase/transferase [Lentisphaerota bacterium]MBT5605316.1 sulfatase-like hydrolase/transferase [Lentisphaerota bacterium]MBT7057534.1 sulfatase-like hydrolase/transferase [Lentisphaerota bacterium]MBT7840700.1 sulfatase-like hydrolase/transferase [Lentisphaerota bacterium]